MRRRRAAWATVALLAAAACTSAPPTEPLRDEFTTFPPPPTTTAAPVATTAPRVTTTPPETVAPVGPAPGRLVVLDGDGNVAVVAPDGSEVDVITDAENEGAAYFQPLWAPGGEALAWGEAGPAGFGLATAEPDGSNRIVAGTPSPPFYFFWGPDGRQVAVLHNGTNGVDLRFVDVGTTVGTFAGSGTPFYISWSPDGAGLVAHIGLDRLATITAAGATTELAPTAPGYQAPQWLPIGVVHLAGDALVLIPNDGPARPLATLRGNASFVANPQGTMLAVQSFAEDEPALSVSLQQVPEVRPNVVAIVDLVTGSVTTASQERSIGFFWSPDGERLLILDVTDEPATIDASVWDSSGTRPVVRFRPPASLVRDVLPFFGQYAQSYQMWAPDSAHFAFAGTVDGESGIWVQPVDGSPPERVATGTWVAWSDR